jgi:hypothetical protein
VSKIRGSIEWIDVPAEFRARARALAAFFGDDRVIGKCFSDAPNDCGFRSTIRLCDKIDFAFVFNPLRLLGARANNRGRFSRCLESELEIFVHLCMSQYRVKEITNAAEGLSAESVRRANFFFSS